MFRHTWVMMQVDYGNQIGGTIKRQNALPFAIITYICNCVLRLTDSPL